ncbi:hypothetical protein ES707_10356 [subsurface metagenome]
MQKNILVACTFVVLKGHIVYGRTEPDNVQMLAFDSTGESADGDVVRAAVDEQDSDIGNVHVVGWALCRVCFGTSER